MFDDILNQKGQVNAVVAQHNRDDQKWALRLHETTIFTKISPARGHFKNARSPKHQCRSPLRDHVEASKMCVSFRRNAYFWFLTPFWTTSVESTAFDTRGYLDEQKWAFRLDETTTFVNVPRPLGAHFEAQEAHLEALLEPVCCPSWDCGDLENVRFVYAKRYFSPLEAILK